jgi:hypothetical protein
LAFSQLSEEKKEKETKTLGEVRKKRKDTILPQKKNRYYNSNYYGECSRLVGNNRK